MYVPVKFVALLDWGSGLRVEQSGPYLDSDSCAGSDCDYGCCYPV